MTLTNNPIELQLKVSVNENKSKVELNRQLGEMSSKLSAVKVPIMFDESALKAFAKLANADFSKLSGALKPFQDEVKRTATMTEEEMKKAAKKASDAIGMEFGRKHKVQSVEELKKQLKGLDASVKIKYDAKDAQKGIEQLTATIEKNGIRQKIAFERAYVDMGNGAVQSMGWMPKTITETDNVLKNVSKSFEAVSAKIRKLKDDGKITGDEFERLSRAMKTVGNVDTTRLERVNQLSSDMVRRNKELTAEQARQAAELAKQEKIQESIRKLNRDIVAATAKNPRAFANNQEITGMLNALNRINPAAIGSAEAVARVSNRFKDMRAEATEAGRSSMTVMESLKIAMEKFPVWMAASTAFFGTLRGIKDAISQIVEIDSQMTVLKRVSGGQMEVNEVLRESIRLSGELGNKIADINEGFIAFARQGFRGDDLTMMAEYATLLGNISDMSVEESASVLTAALKGFNKDATEGIHIVNALNEVDNNYAITTQQLSEALMRAAGAAATYGVEMERNIGFTTAIGQVTRESGSVIGNSLKSIYSRINSISGAVDELDAIGISVKDMGGDMRDVQDVLDDLGAQWKHLSSEQQQNLGIQIAGRYQLSRFLILMENYDEALQAASTATHSAGSAYRENAEYLKSYEARINMVKNAWTEAILAMQDTGLGDGIVNTLDVGLALFSALGKVIEVVGVLPAMIGAATIAFALFNTNMKLAVLENGKFVVSTLMATKASTAGATATSLYSRALTMLSTALTRAGAASVVMVNGLRAIGVFLAGAALPLAGLMAVGAIISAITSKIVEQREKQKELNAAYDDYKKKTIDAVSTNKEQVDGLIESYNKLSVARNTSDWSNEKEEEYLKIQQELGELFPSLIDYIDEKGRTHLKASEEIDKEITAAKELYEVEQRIKLLNSEKTYKNKIKEIRDYTNAVRDANAELEKEVIVIKGFNDKHRDTTIARAESTALLNKGFASGAAQELARMFIEDYVIEISLLGKTISPVLQEEMSKAVATVNVTLFSPKELAAFRKNLADMTASMDEAFKLGDKKGFKDLSAQFQTLLVTMGATEAEAKNMTPTFNQVRERVDSLEKSAREAAKTVGDMGEGMQSAGDQAGVAGEEIVKFKDALEQLAGVSKEQLVANDELIFSYESLASRTNLTAREVELLSNIQSKLVENNKVLSSESMTLMSRYEDLTTSIGRATANSEELHKIEKRLTEIHPELIKNGIRREAMMSSIIAKIKEEEKANDILLAATIAASNGKLTAEEKASLASLEETNARINNINSEILALDKLRDAYSYFNEGAKKAAVDAATSVGMGGALAAAMQASKLATQVGIDLQRNSKLADLAGNTSNRNKLVNELAQSEAVLSNTTTSGNKALLEQMKANEKATKAQKDAAKAMEQSIFIADKYKRALELLNLEIKKQQDIRDNTPDYSKEHLNSLQAEIKLQHDKTALMQAQSKALEAQIKSGKILQTGVVTTSVGGQKLSGWDGRITSQFGNRTAPTKGASTNHQGIDIAGKNGTRVDSNVNGTVTFAGNKGNGLGNYVAIKDASGNTNIYGHLQDVLVKAGQSIAQGVALGTIGSTGTSTGNHLHYQINDASGKAINPNSAVNAAKSGTSVAAASKEAANVQQAIDNAQSELLNLNGQILDQQALIAKLELDVINSNLSYFDQKRQSYDRVLAFEAEKIQTLDVYSQRYGATIERQGKFLEYKQKANQEELKYLEGLIAKGNLSAIALDAMKIKAEELTTQMLILDTTIKNNNFNLIMVSAQRFAEEMSELEYSLQRSKLIGGLLEEGTTAYSKEIESQTAMLKKQQDAVATHRDELQKKILTENLSIEKIKELSKTIQDLSLQYLQLETAMKDSTKALEDSNRKMRDDLADDLINSYKEYLEEKRDMHLKSIDEELEAENKRHKKVMDNLSDELKMYREIIQTKLDSINKEESERDYNKEIDQLQEERLKILSRINLLSMDDSFESKAERKRLQEDLAKIDDTIAEKQHKREVDLRKENLQDMLKDKEKEIEEKQKLEDEKFNATVEGINKEKKYWEQHHKDLLNDEREFARIKKEIVAGNFEAIKGEFEGYRDYLERTMPSLENTLDGTMKAVGTSIRKNIIDRLKEALDLLGKVQEDTGGGSNSSGSGSGGEAGGKAPISTANMKVLAAKYLSEDLKWKDTNPARRVHIQAKADALAAQGRAEGSSIGIDVGLQAALAQLSKEDLARFGEFLTQTGTSYVSTPELQDLIRQYGIRLKSGHASMREGGITGSWGSAGKWLEVHEEEGILTKSQTKDFIQADSLLNNIRHLMDKIVAPQRPSLSASGLSDKIDINFHIENMNGTQQEAKNFGKMAMDELKRKRGTR